MLSITPRKYLHDLIFDHTDSYSSTHSDDATTISQAGFNCHCEDLVVSTPFVNVSLEMHVPAGLHYKAFSPALYSSFFSNTHITKDLRGPPRVS